MDTFVPSVLTVTIGGEKFPLPGYEKVRVDDREPVNSVIQKIITLHCQPPNGNDPPTEVFVNALYANGQIIVNACGYKNDIDIHELMPILEMENVKTARFNMDSESPKGMKGTLRVIVTPCDSTRNSQLVDYSTNMKKRRIEEVEETEKTEVPIVIFPETKKTILGLTWDYLVGKDLET